MENRYLFRGRRTDNNEWVQGYLFQNGETTVIITEVIDDGCTIKIKVAFVVEPETIGQYTGLKDRNGMLIYEGDIVKNSIALGIVKFGNPDFHKGSMCSMFYWEMVKQLDHKQFCFKDDVFTEFKDVKVIGNIYNNLELTEE